MLSDLVSQLLATPIPKELTLRDPICPSCRHSSNPQPRARTHTTGRLLPYCRDCLKIKNDINNDLRRQK